MPDYQGNSNKDKEKKEKPEIKQITTGEVKMQKKTTGQKFKELFIKEDLGTVTRNVFYDVLIPAIINTIIDTSTQAIQNIFKGHRQGVGSKSYTTYNNPVSRTYSYIQDTRGVPNRPGMRELGASRVDYNNVLVSSREEADNIIEMMREICDQYKTTSVADLYKMIGAPRSYVDDDWGWDHEALRSARVQQYREGYLLDLPQPQPLK